MNSFTLEVVVEICLEIKEQQSSPVIKNLRVITGYRSFLFKKNNILVYYYLKFVRKITLTANIGLLQ